VGYAAKTIVHIGIVMLAFVGAYELRRGLPLDWWFSDPQAKSILLWAVAFGGIAACVELVTRIERSAWRFSSVKEALIILRSTAITSLAFLALIFLSDRAITLPRSSLILAWILSFLGLVGIRLIWRLVHNPGLLLGASDRRRSADARPLLIVGEPSAADVQIRHLELSNPDNYNPVGIIATDDSVKGLMVKGVPVLGRASSLMSIAKAVFGTRMDQGAIVFLADPVQDLALSPEAVGRLRKAGVLLLRLPRVVELSRGDPGAGRLRPIALEEFLPRKPVDLDPAPLREILNGRTALVTGAGGSIGSELSRQLAAMGCSTLCLLDQSEFGLFEIDRELRTRFPELVIHPILCDVRDGQRVNHVFDEHRPALVFHAAALKHVTLVEQNAEEGFLTNVLGTRNVVEASKEYGVAQMTLISTDKAVEPTSVMGATKRIAEAVVAAQEKTRTKFSTVRFGNVLGSAGSVIPIFQSQIERGGPVTVTDPDVERYFMTIPEAVQLVLHATALVGSSAETTARRFVLDMGKPVKILDIAEQLIGLYGLRPGQDIQIEFTGLKPGEKLTELLTEPEEVVEERIPGVLEIVSAEPGASVDGAAAARLAETLAHVLVRERVQSAVASGDLQALMPPSPSGARRKPAPASLN